MADLSRGDVMPLTDFPIEQQERIAHLVAQPTPPPRWIDLGLARIQSRAWFEWHWARGAGRNPTKRKKIPPRWRDLIIKRDGYICGICGGDVDPTDVHLDHKIPWSRVREHTLDNLQVAHSTCNILKGARAGDE